MGRNVRAEESRAEMVLGRGVPEPVPGLNAVNAKNIVRRQTRLSSVRNAVNAFMCHAQILVGKN